MSASLVTVLCNSAPAIFSGAVVVCAWDRSLSSHPTAPVIFSQDDVGQVQGSAVTLCQILGIPFVRFRAAVPSEWFSGSVAQSIGRKHGLSAAAVKDYTSQIRERWEDLNGGGCFGGKRKKKIPELELDGTREDNLRRLAMTRSVRQSVVLPPPGGRTSMAAAASGRYPPPLSSEDAGGEGAFDDDGVPDVTVETIVGTALIFAFLAATRLLPMKVLGERQRAAAYHFGSEAGTFLDLQARRRLAQHAGCRRPCVSTG